MVMVSKISGGAEMMNAKEVLEKGGLEEGMKVVDLGCGTKGYFAFQAAKLVGQKGFVYAVDILKSVLQRVENTSRFLGVNNLKTLWADLEVYKAVKLGDSSIDFAIVINLFFQTKKHEEILKEIDRLVKKEGKILIADWKKTSFLFGPPVNLRVTPDYLKKLIKKFNWRLEKEFEAGPSHYVLVFIKK